MQKTKQTLKAEAALAEDALSNLFEKLRPEVEAPQIEEALEKAKLVLAQKVGQRVQWRCSRCGNTGCQIRRDENGSEDGHIYGIVIEDGVPIHNDGSSLTAEERHYFEVALKEKGGTDYVSVANKTAKGPRD